MALNVLFTSVGRRVELVRAFNHAYESLGISGRTVGIDVDPLAPALTVCGKSYIVPKVSCDEYIPILTRICEQENISLIFPLIDPDIPVLDRHRTSLEKTGARLCVVHEEAVNIVGDKWNTFNYFRAQGISTPASWLPEQLPHLQLSFPLFIKPRSGSAGNKAFRVEDIQQLQFFLQYVPEPIIQEWIPGPEITSDVIVTPDGEILAVVSRERIEVRQGEVSKGITIRNQGIIDACVQIARTLPAIGPITVQCLMKGEKFYFTEINARFGGGVPLGIAAGVDSPKYLLAGMANIKIDIPSMGTYEEGLYITRFDESFFLTKTQYEQISSNHI